MNNENVKSGRTTRETTPGIKKREIDDLFQINVGLFKPFIIHGGYGMIESG